MSYQAQQNTQWTSPYAVQNAPLPGSGGPSPMDQAVAGAPPGLIGGGSSSQQAQFSPQGLPAQNAPLPTAGAMAGEPPKEEKGFFGKLIGGVTSFVKGATVGLASSIVESFKDPKTWLLTAVGVIAIATGFGAPVGALLIGYGLTQTLPGLANSVGSAVKHYNNGETALAEKALEDAGTNAGAIGLSAVGIRGLVRTGGIPTRYTKRNGNEVGLKTRHNVVAQAASDIAYLTRYNMHQVGRVFNKEARAKGRENLTALRESLGTNGLLQTAKNGWRDSMSSAGTYMQQDRLSGHAGNVGRNGTTQLSRAQVADELVPALNGRGRIEVGGRRIERAAAEQHARENGYVPVAAERGKPVWMTRDEALQLHRDAVLAKDIPALYRRVDETKAALDNLKASHSEGVRLSWRESRQLSAAERAHQQANQAVSKAERSFARTTRSVNNEIFKPERIQAAEHARVASAAAATEAATPEGSATPAGITEAVTPDAPRISTGTTPARATTVNGMKQELSDLDSRIANAQPGQARNQLYGERNILLERIK
ncbi:MAG: hypothetical protein VKJ04_06345, partial [Vampirovibrionales bacterium]|nr:hypothetical protein [Vampirovibrionales bacterium]